MAKLSRAKRAIIRETVRQTIANLGFIAPVKQESLDSGENESSTQDDPEQAGPKNFFDIVSELITVGIAGLLFILCCAGVLNFFGQFPQIINFSAWGITFLILFGAGKMVFFHKRHWFVLIIAIFSSVVICCVAWSFVKGSESKIAALHKESAEERTVITNLPSQIADLKFAITNTHTSSMNEPLPVLFTLLDPYDENKVIFLTNEFLYGFSILGGIIVPIRHEAIKVPLCFGIQNASRTEPAENVELVIGCETNLDFDFSKGWENRILALEVTNQMMESRSTAPLTLGPSQGDFSTLTVLSIPLESKVIGGVIGLTARNIRGANANPILARIFFARVPLGTTPKPPFVLRLPPSRLNITSNDICIFPNPKNL